MNDDTPAGDAPEASAPETPKENKDARAAIAAAQERRRGPGRPPKVRDIPGDAVRHSETNTDTNTTPADGAPAKRKKKSGRHPTRAEMAAELRVFRAASQGGAPAAVAGAAPAPVSSLVAGNPEAKAKFSAGFGRVLSALSRVVARRRGVHWQIDDAEAGALGDAAADCLEATEEMAPSVTPWIQTAAKLAPFAILGGVAYEIVDSRIEIDQQIASGERTRILPGEPKGVKLAKVD